MNMADTWWASAVIALILFEPNGYGDAWIFIVQLGFVRYIHNGILSYLKPTSDGFLSQYCHLPYQFRGFASSLSHLFRSYINLVFL